MIKKICLITLLFTITANIAQADVNMAVIAPMHGEYEKFGNEIINGVKIAVENINQQGGLNGEKINLITVDDPCHDHFAVTTAQMMAVNTSKTDKVNLVIGPYCQNSFEKISEIYAKANIFQIIPTTTNLQNIKTSQKGLVKMIGSEEQQSKDVYKYYQTNFAEETLALVYDSTNKNIVDVALTLQKEFISNDNRPKLKIFNFEAYKNDLDEMAKDIIDSEAKLGFILGQPKKVAKLSKEIKNENDKFKIFTSRYQANADYEKIMGDTFTETLVKLRLLGLEPEGLGVYGYSAVILWQDLVNKASSFSYDDLSNALNENKIETPWGETLYTNSNPDNSTNYSIFQLNSGEYTQVY